MRRITISIEKNDRPELANAWLIIPRPLNDWHQDFHSVHFSGISEMHEIGAGHSEQRAYLLKTDPTEPPAIEYRFTMTECKEPPEWIWQQQENRHTSASPELVDLAKALTDRSNSQVDAVRCLIEHAAEIFGYGHRDEYFHHGHDTVPVVCGTTKGSCVDINTFLMAAARSLGIPVQYMAGYWFHPDKTETLDMHCWLAFNADNEALFWDLAHHMKWGVEKLSPCLNPAGGRRVAMSCGRGLSFETPNGNVEISHFSEPVWVLPRAEKIRPGLKIRIDDE
jgi:hypothetical protein